METYTLSRTVCDEDGTPGKPAPLSPNLDRGEVLGVPWRGEEVLRRPLYNRGTAFTHADREALGLTGLLPAAVNTIEQQAERMRESIERKEKPLEKYIGLAALQDRNEVLFHRVIYDNIERYMPVIYTPTVGKACMRYSRIFRRARGLWVTLGHSGKIEEVLSHAPYTGVRLIVVTDGERILGLGDQGAGGMGIPIGKLSLYTVGAGIHPSQTLPICLDVGTDNERLLEDPLYLGWRHPRLRGERYDNFVEEFVAAVKNVFPDVLLQWEDFKQQNALRLLDRYRERLPSFNDDIQGTAGIALAAMLASTRISKTPLEELRIVIAGAGAAGIGIGRLLRSALRTAGVGEDEITERIAMLDSRGHLIAERVTDDPFKQEFAWSSAKAQLRGLPADRSGTLEEVIAAVKPHVLIGTTGHAGQFDETIVREMAKHTERPAIFPFSNPTSHSEATPEDLIRWTQGKALIATGSPFDPVEFEEQTIHTSQGNNVYVFPGVGLGALVSQATEISDAMFTAAAHAIAELVSEDDLSQGKLLPPLGDLREVSARVAMAVAREARTTGVAAKEVAGAITDDALEATVRGQMWVPNYPQINAV